MNKTSFKGAAAQGCKRGMYMGSPENERNASESEDCKNPKTDSPQKHGMEVCKQEELARGFEYIPKYSRLVLPSIRLNTWLDYTKDIGYF